MINSKEEEKIRLLAATAMSACNEYIESRFKDKNYDDYPTDEKLRIIKVLKRNGKLYARYQA
mgnify:CR=1 FL=1